MATIEKKLPKISVIILNYNTGELVRNLVRLLGTADDVEVLVVDNSPDDSIKEHLPDYVRYFKTEKNLGFAGGNNFGIKQAKGDWIFLLNSDCEANIKDIVQLVQITEKAKYLVAAPKLLYKDGSTQINVGVFDTFFTNPVNYFFLRPHFTLRRQTFNLLTGAAMLIHESIFSKIGLLDEKLFFMYFEDMDFSYRLYKKNIQVLYVPEVTIFHFEGAASNQDPKQKSQNYQKGLFNYIKKHRGKLIANINTIFQLLK